MKLLVCGGAGFIGSTFVRLRVREHGDEVTVLDKLTYAGRRENLRDVSRRDPRSCTARSRIRRPSPTRSRGADAIVNFAAETHVDRSIAGPVRVQRHQRAGHPRAARGGPRARPALRAGLDRRGLRLDRDGLVHRGLAAAALIAPTARPRPAPTCSSPATSTPTGWRRWSAAARTTTGPASTPRS